MRQYNYPIGAPELIFFEDEVQVELVYPMDLCNRSEDDEINWLYYDAQDWFIPGEGFCKVYDDGTDLPF